MVVHNYSSAIPFPQNFSDYSLNNNFSIQSLRIFSFSLYRTCIFTTEHSIHFLWSTTYHGIYMVIFNVWNWTWQRGHLGYILHEHNGLSRSHQEPRRPALNNREFFFFTYQSAASLLTTSVYSVCHYLQNKFRTTFSWLNSKLLWIQKPYIDLDLIFYTQIWVFLSLIWMVQYSIFYTVSILKFNNILQWTFHVSLTTDNKCSVSNIIDNKMLKLHFPSFPHIPLLLLSLL